MAVNKTYIYSVYGSLSGSAGAFLGNLQNVTNDFQYSQVLGTATVQLQIEIGLSPDLTHEASEAILAETGASITDESGSDLLVENAASVLGLSGGGNLIATGNQIEVFEISEAYPNGHIVFIGNITRWKLDYDNSKIIVTAMSIGMTSQNYIAEDAGATTLTYSSYDPANIIGDLVSKLTDSLDADGHDVFWLSGSVPSTIDLTGLSVSYVFNSTTYWEAIKKAAELSPDDYYLYISPGGALIFRQTATTATHTLYYGRHFSAFEIESNIEQAANAMYFTGGDTGGGVNLYKRTVDSGSISLIGRYAVQKTDNRVTTDPTANAIINSYLDGFAGEQFTAEVTVPDGTYVHNGAYDISSFFLGETVALRGFGNFIENLLLQIVGIRYTPDAVTLTLGRLPERTTRAIKDLQKGVLDQQTVANPSTPS